MNFFRIEMQISSHQSKLTEVENALCEDHLVDADQSEEPEIPNGKL